VISIPLDNLLDKTASSCAWNSRVADHLEEEAECADVAASLAGGRY
jgi:hypothetical protein